MQHIKRIIFLIEALSEWSGRIVAWLVLVMALVVGYDVIMRYLFHSGSVALQEVEWHLFALIFLMGSAYTFKHDSHVRVDIFYNSHWMNDRRRAWLDLLGGLFLLTPFCLLIIISSFSFVENSYLMGESSPDPGGLSFRYLLKAAIPVGFILIFLQGIAH
ncbi:MAG: TRAP transporter small permease subunit, partial [Gammaproteobacteria bacterium]|nr:TRAP transporter small permease subunit [Gammaproteobacteria bacterium]